MTVELPDGIEHGYTAYNKLGCRCFTCRLAGHEYRSKWYAEQMAGKSRLVDVTPAREHYLRWHEKTGCGQIVFSRLSGVSHRTMFDVVACNRQRIKRSTAEAILAVPITADPIPDIDEVPSLGYRRRVEALAAIGYGAREQARRMGISDGNLLTSVRGAKIHRKTADRIARLYDELYMTPAPRSHGSIQARAYAQRKGWLPPLAWDDIDDPNERPQLTDAPRSKTDLDHAVVERVIRGERLSMTRAERLEVVRRLRDDWAWSEERIETHTGISKSTNRDRYPTRPQEDAA